MLCMQQLRATSPRALSPTLMICELLTVLRIHCELHFHDQRSRSGIDIFLIILQHWGLPLEHYRVVSNSTTYTKELHNSTIVNSRKSRVPHPQKKLRPGCRILRKKLRGVRTHKTNLYRGNQRRTQLQQIFLLKSWKVSQHTTHAPQQATSRWWASTRTTKSPSRPRNSASSSPASSGICLTACRGLVWHMGFHGEFSRVFLRHRATCWAAVCPGGPHWICIYCFSVIMILSNYIVFMLSVTANISFSGCQMDVHSQFTTPTSTWQRLPHDSFASKLISDHFIVSWVFG